MSPLALTVLAPLAAAVTIPLLRRGAPGLAVGGAALGLIASVWLLAGVAGGETPALVLPGLPGMPLRLAAEPLTALLAVVVATVGSLVLVYAVGYMRREPGRVRFFALMSLFLAAMQTLVLAGDWVLLLGAWEIIGLCSYLLIGFWFQRPEAATAAGRAFLYTRSADLGLYVAVFLLIATAGSSEIAASLDAGGGTTLAAGLLLLLAAMGKSAQTPLQDWLMRAMAGPTPVSALLHSATLVAAGAILLIRTAPMLPPGALLAVGLVGGVTTVVTGLIALAEGDLKRLLAASTASQYGLMLLAVGAGVPLAALLHLIAHAAIKSALFLGAGTFQHARGDTAFECLRGAGRARPWTFLGFTLAALALAGIPPLSGFFSKDAVIAAALAAPGAAWLAPLALAGTLLTGAYMARALHLLWRGAGEDRPVTGARWMGAGLAGLVAIAVALGAAFGAIGDLLATPVPKGTWAMLLGLAAALGGLALGWLVPVRRLLGPLYRRAQHGLVIAGGLTAWIGRPTMAIARGCERLERGLHTTVLGVGHLALAIARRVRSGDERRIDGLIFTLVAGVRDLGAQARTLQSGLIHRELALSAAGAAALLVVLLAMLLRF
ncbi:NADH dehydrogenase (quinone) [Salinisphaera sp. PC39]|uniref:NADH-quinone oxidoreductase subunit 5 family protein n=1 Tax=Salinisphaera sp. PC39 TaxID=1304156 RepID=UPI00333E7420